MYRILRAPKTTSNPPIDSAADVFKLQEVKPWDPRPESNNESSIESLAIEFIISYIVSTVSHETGWVIPTGAYLNFNKMKAWYAVQGRVKADDEKNDLGQPGPNERFADAFHHWLSNDKNKKQDDRKGEKYRRPKPWKYKADDRFLIWIFQGCEGSVKPWLYQMLLEKPKDDKVTKQILSMCVQVCKTFYT